jgi:hypothetical protein
MPESYDLSSLSPEQLQSLLKKLMAIVRPGATGKWRRSRIPRSGWRSIAGYVATGERPRCDMCEARRIRHVRVMVHQELPGVVLKVGRTCAKHMEKEGLVARESQTGAREQSFG